MASSFTIEEPAPAARPALAISPPASAPSSGPLSPRARPAPAAGCGACLALAADNAKLLEESQVLQAVVRQLRIEAAEQARRSEALATARRAVAASGLGKAPPPARAMSLIAQAKAQRANGDRAGARASLDQVDAIVPALGPAGARLATAAADVRKAL